VGIDPKKLLHIPAIAKAERTKLEEAFLSGLRMFGRDLPAPAREHQFDAQRKWRFDFAFLDQRIAVEIHGGASLGARGGHTSAAGLRRDSEKSTAANLQGWVLLTFTADQLTLRALPETIDKVRAAIAKSSAPRTAQRPTADPAPTRPV
jgi:hypothetical protein